MEIIENIAMINPADHKTLLEDVETLRAQFPQTKALYREVCSLMFFRYGIQPTTNKLYQLVRKGTMSTPAEAVSQFWDELREKSRVHIAHPGLPEHLQDFASDAFSTLWKAALDTANQNLQSLREDLESTKMHVLEQVAARDAQQTALAATNVQLQTEIDSLKVELKAAQDQNLLDSQSLQHQNATIHSLQQDRKNLESQLKTLQDDFSREASKLHESLKITEYRFRSLETRTMLDVEREREKSRTLEQQLKATNKAHTKAQASAQRQADKNQLLISKLREDIGVLKGQLKSTR